MGLTRRIGELDLHAVDAYGVEWTVQEVSGWGMPASSREFTQRPRQPGAWASTGFSKNRDIAVSGTINADSVDGAAAALDRLYSVVARQPARLIIDEGSGERWVDVLQTDEVIPTWLNDTTVRYSFQVASTDWRKFGEAQAGVTQLPSTSGGLAIGGSDTGSTNGLYTVEQGQAAADAVGLRLDNPTGGLYPLTTRDGSPANQSFVSTLSLAGVERTTYAWTGAANASSSTVSVNGIIQRTNEIPNPGFNTDVAGWGTFSSSTISWLATGSATLGVTADLTSGSSFVTCANLPAQPGGKKSFAIDVSNTSTSSVSLAAWMRNNGGTAVSTTGPTATIEPGATQRLTVSDVTMPSGTTSVSLFLKAQGATLKAGSSLKLDNAIMESAPSTGAFFDGSFPEVVKGGFSVPFQINATTVTGQVNLVNPGNESGPVVLRIDGPCTGPVVTHVSTGNALVFSSSLVLQENEYLLIDMDARTALANGQANRAGYITSRGWSAFDSGPNTWAFSAARFNSKSQLTVTAVPAWR